MTNQLSDSKGLSRELHNKLFGHCVGVQLILNRRFLHKIHVKRNFGDILSVGIKVIESDVYYFID